MKKDNELVHELIKGTYKHQEHLESEIDQIHQQRYFLQNAKADQERLTEIRAILKNENNSLNETQQLGLIKNIVDVKEWY